MSAAISATVMMLIMLIVGGALLAWIRFMMSHVDNMFWAMVASVAPVIIGVWFLMYVNF